MSNKEPNDYEQYLSALHSKLATPDELIRDMVKEGSGLEEVSKAKIVAGEANEVYDIDTGGKEHLILRVSPHGYPDFQQEIWSINQAKKVGVPAPTILKVKYVKVNGEERSMCLMEKMAGEPLERGGIDFGELDPKLQRNLINQGGEILSRIHSIKTNGFGWIVKDQGQKANSDYLLDELEEKKAQLMATADAVGIERTKFEQAFGVIESFRGWYSGIEPRLNHGDYGHKHFMMKNDQIVGILDWGGVRSDTPIYDIAMWDYWFGDFIPTEWLKEGYTDKSLFEGNFEDVLHMLRLFKGLEIISWYHQQNYKPAVEKAKVKFLSDLNFF